MHIGGRLSYLHVSFLLGIGTVGAAVFSAAEEAKEPKGEE